jgi:hypothetical protein
LAQEKPLLQPPGAGLPLAELLLVRYWVFPRWCARTSWDDAVEMFDKEGERILLLAETLDEESLVRPVLIKRLRGLEDSSRYWSVAMTMEHLTIVGDLMSQIIVSLSQGERPKGRVGTADVKPSGQIPAPKVVLQFTQFLERFASNLEENVVNKDCDVTYPHPWFGELTARKWHTLAGIHQGLHRTQVEAIIRGL